MKIKKLICYFFDHDWNFYRGYEQDKPAAIAACKRCGTKSNEN